MLPAAGPLKRREGSTYRSTLNPLTGPWGAEHSFIEIFLLFMVAFGVGIFIQQDNPQHL